MRDDARVSDDDIDGRVDLEGFRSVFADAAVQYAVLFGSYATGAETDASDLDVCVRFPDELSRRERFRRRNRIDSALQSYADPFVDVSDLEALPETVALNALRDGQLLYGDFETKAADERRLERQVDASSDERDRRRREFIDRLAKGDV
ncbi:DNA polymerase III subunit beta [Halobiforma lacisalsi AJ5]|uniref:DNA polymerase III subunit beta n=2 Tax=Natronobacterium TaxID=2256 RepID=M0LF98_NATLA|nr:MULTISPECIES: nucleotidyltransferase domain-containing protein [Halobiforma]APW98866.1 DNA polymerase III subunit beta [Halobiforma lacisalsi AJ5]EMA32231.1 DNA polymerase beta domain-containing protein [Halobiforma lacisalsi AJ5]SFC59634.1 Nucleotidyltransferase domain-containing protein [Halobiforma haloterrestris]